jgi:site-specific recombinase XerD
VQFSKLLADFETWLRDDQDRGDLTVKAYLTDVQNFAIWLKQTYGREYQVERVTPTDIKDYRTWLQTIQKQKASSINRRLSALRTFFKWAALSDRVGRSPLNGIKPLRQQEAPPRWLDPQAEHKLQQALELHAPPVSAETPLRPFERLLYRDVAMLLLMWKAGLRVSEVAALDFSDVKIQSSKRGTVEVRAGKGRKTRGVPLNADVIEALNTWFKICPKTNRPALFVSRSGIRITARAVQGTVEQIGHEAAALIKARSSDDRVIADALNALTPHVLRHTCGKRMLDAGAQLTEVAAILGHEDLNTTRRYTQPGQEDLHRAVGRIASHE